MCTAGIFENENRTDGTDSNIQCQAGWIARMQRGSM